MAYGGMHPKGGSPSKADKLSTQGHKKANKGGLGNAGSPGKGGSKGSGTKLDVLSNRSVGSRSRGGKGNKQRG